MAAKTIRHALHCVACILLLVHGERLAAAAQVNQDETIRAGPTRCPYPRSSFITGCDIHPKVISFPSHVSRPGDNWPVTWASDGKIYTFLADGSGFNPLPKWCSMHPCVLQGNPSDGSLSGRDIPTNTIGTGTGGGGKGRKVSGLIAIPDPANTATEMLVAWVRNVTRKGGASLMVSRDHGATWTWVWGEPDTDAGAVISELGHPSWVQAGKGHANAPDEYLYFISHDKPSAYQLADQVILGRVRRDAALDRARYEYLSGTEGSPAWSADIRERKATFTAKGLCYRLYCTYNPALKRYLLLTSNGGGGISGHAGTHDLGIYESERPWGPWRTVYWNDAFQSKWGVFSPQIVPAWISEDGKNCWLLYSCYPDGPYKFNLQQLVLTIVE